MTKLEMYELLSKEVEAALSKPYKWEFKGKYLILKLKTETFDVITLDFCIHSAETLEGEVYKPYDLFIAIGSLQKSTKSILRELYYELLTVEQSNKDYELVKKWTSKPTLPDKFLAFFEKYF